MICSQPRSLIFAAPNCSMVWSSRLMYPSSPIDRRLGFRAKLIGAKNKWMCLESGKYGRKASTAPREVQNIMCSPVIRALGAVPDHHPATVETIGCHASWMPSDASRNDSPNMRAALCTKMRFESFCALLRDGTLRCSQFEMDSPTEIRANSRVIDPGLSDVTDVVTGGQFVCALDRSGEVWCWGSN